MSEDNTSEAILNADPPNKPTTLSPFLSYSLPSPKAIVCGRCPKSDNFIPHLGIL